MIVIHQKVPFSLQERHQPPLYFITSSLCLHTFGLSTAPSWPSVGSPPFYCSLFGWGLAAEAGRSRLFWSDRRTYEHPGNTAQRSTTSVFITAVTQSCQIRKRPSQILRLGKNTLKGIKSISYTVVNKTRQIKDCGTSN